MLTTPVIKDEDLVFPGEGWFLYWKTSASLWKAKLEEIGPVSKIIIPINWSFHSDTGERFDFANEKPETDLAKLYEICKEQGKEAIFLMPLTPMPFLPNGGIPFVLARSLAKEKNGLAKVCVASDESLNHIYSFFDPRVYTAYTRFCSEISAYFSRSGIGAGIWGLECGKLEEGRFSSFVEDYSSAYDQGFSKFVKANREDGKPLSLNDELELKSDYLQMISNLYKDCAKEELSTFWLGEKSYGFLLSEVDQVFKRSLDTTGDIEIFDQVFDCLENKVFPSSILVPSRKKAGLYKSFSEKILGRDAIDYYYSDRSISHTLEYAFKSSYTVKIFYKDDQRAKANPIESGFIDFCKNKFPWDYHFSKLDDFYWEDELESNSHFFYFSGEQLDMKLLSGSLRMFMNGLNVFIDKRNMSDELVRRLESFYIENDLEIESIRYLTQIDTISMGQGRLFIFDSSDLMDHIETKGKIESFWAKAFSAIDYTGFNINSEGGIRHIWQERKVGSGDLKFEKIKRLNIFNPSSYKRKIKINYESDIVFQKIVDEQNVDISNKTHEVEVSLLPKGSVSLDFGVIAK